MRNKIFLPVAAIICSSVLFSSCSKVVNDLAQSIAWQGVDVTISVPPVSDTTLQTTVGTGTFTYNLDSLIKNKTNNALGLANVDTFEMTSCTLTIQNPDANNNFQNFQLAKGTFNTSFNSTIANIGEVDNNPNTSSATLSLPVNSSLNLKSYLNSTGNTTITYGLEGKLRTGTTTTLTILAHFDYHMHVKL